jgi:glyoxylase I family protein
MNQDVFAPKNDAAIVRYLVDDLERSVAFYTRHLGFELTKRAGPIAVVTRGDLHLLLSGGKASGARKMPDGTQQQPGGWNRIVTYVTNIEERITELKSAGVHFRNEMESGPGGKQILVEDPDGNVIELHEAPK